MFSRSSAYGTNDLLFSPACRTIFRMPSPIFDRTFYHTRAFAFFTFHFLYLFHFYTLLRFIVEIPKYG